MASARPPWRTGKDTREHVLGEVLRETAARPEIAKDLAPGAEPEDVLAEVISVVRPVRETVLASADEAESRYRGLAVKLRSETFEYIEYHPLVGELFALVVIPAFALSAVAGLPDMSAPVREIWPQLAMGGGAGLIIGVAMLIHKRMSSSGWARARIWALTAVVIFGLVAPVFFARPGREWWWLPFGILIAATWVLMIGGLSSMAFPAPTWVDRRRAALEAFAEWRRALAEEGVLPVLFTKLNEAAGASTTLTVRDTHLLRRTNPMRMHVATPASAELNRLIDRLGGGSFALAGPRGAGKSNLLRAFCGGRYRDARRRSDLAVQVSAPVEYVPHEFVLHLFGATCRAAIGYVRQVAPAVAKYAERQHGFVLTRIANDLRRGKLSLSPLFELASGAQANLLLLQYVQSYTMEINTKTGIKGFEVGGKRATSLQGRALTYPELIDRFREFLKDAVTVLATDAGQLKPGRVLIGIDELDRLGTGEPARRFLNEVKAIFDVSGCYYLVTVSTEAQHDFELSGMGLRSVFDSSFDEVVRVDYLDFEHAKKLLRRYVIGLSEQFLALAYVLSGGLARQLVRTARAISEHNGESLGAVAAALADMEVLRTCQATADALASADDRAGVSPLLGALDDRPAKVAGEELRTYAGQVLASYQGASERVGELRDVVGARMYFLATVLEVFTEELTRDRLTAVAGGFDALARARRYLGVNPTTAIALIDACRTAWSLPTLERGQE